MTSCPSPVPLATPACVCFPDQFPPNRQEQLVLQLELAAPPNTQLMSVALTPVKYNFIRTYQNEQALFSYNSGSGVFTAPFSASYSFNLVFSTVSVGVSAANTLECWIYVNGMQASFTGGFLPPAVAGQTFQNYTFTNLLLQAGDSVQVLASSALGPAYAFQTNASPTPSPMTLAISSLIES